MCDIAPQVMLDHWVRTMNVEKALFARESHKSGDFHLHGVCFLKDTLRSRDARYWDFKGFHPNISKMRNPVESIRYCVKTAPAEDIAQFNMDHVEELKAREGHRSVLGKRLMNGDPLLTVVKDNPYLLFGLTRLQQDLETWNNM